MEEKTKKKSHFVGFLKFIIVILIITFTKPKMQYINVDYTLTETVIYLKISNANNTKLNINDFYILNKNNSTIKASKIENDDSLTPWRDSTSSLTINNDVTVKLTFNQIINKDIPPTLYYLGRELNINSSIRIWHIKKTRQ